MARKQTSKRKKSADPTDPEVSRLLVALRAICTDEGLESNPDDLRILARRFREAGWVFCECLDRAAENHPQAQDHLDPHHGVASDLTETATAITNSLIRYLQAYPEQMRYLIVASDEWPVLAAVDPAKDIRRVNRAPSGPAAKLLDLVDRKGIGTLAA